MNCCYQGRSGKSKTVGVFLGGKKTRWNEQNPNQLGNVVVEDVPEEIPNNNRLTILGGVEGNSFLSTDELHGGTREQVGDVIHLTLNF
ncbi:hypothetical protein FF1_029978 [Malus domestica]